jgi:hypothetical protein
MSATRYPIPQVGTQDWLTLAAMLRGMADESQLRANDLIRPDDMRAGHQATADAYQFAAMMIEQQYYSAK